MKNDMDYSSYDAFVKEAGDAYNTIHDDEFEGLAQRDAVMEAYYSADITGRSNDGRPFFVPGRKRAYA